MTHTIACMHVCMHAAVCVSVDADALLVLLANVCVILTGVLQGEHGDGEPIYLAKRCVPRREES